MAGGSAILNRARESAGARAKPSRIREKNRSSYHPWVPAVDQASRILFCLAESPRHKMALTDICQKVEIYKSKGHSILNTLKEFGLVEKDPQTKAYSLGPGLIFLSRHVLDNLYYPDIAAPFLQSLARETNGTAVFGLIHGDHVFVVGKNEGNQNIGFTLRLGHRFHVTLGAHGKAIVAFMEEEERKKLFAGKKLYFYGDKAALDTKRLKEDFAKCRQLGFARDMGEVTPGVNVISSPLFAHQGKLIGCLILIGAFAEDRMGAYGTKVAEVARQISYRLGADVEKSYRA